MKICLNIFLFIFCSCHLSAGALKTSEEYWKATGMSFEFLQKNILKNCEQDLNSLLGCFDALNSIGSSTQPQMILAFKEESRLKNPVLGPITKDFGAVALFKDGIYNKNYSVIQDWDFKLKARNIHLNATKSFFLRMAQDKKIRIDFSNILNFLKTKMNYQSSDEGEAALSGLAYSSYLNLVFDPHTFVTPSQYWVDVEANADENIKGIGAELDKISGKIFISNILKGYPAEKAGLKSQDVIDSVNSVSVKDKSIPQVVKEIRGPVNSKVLVAILRDGKKLSFSVTRESIDIPNLEMNLIKDMGQPVVHIKISSFVDEHLCEKIKKSWSNYSSEKLKGVVLDLRQNGGGIINQGVCLASLFVGKKIIVQQKSLDTQKKVNLEGEEKVLTSLPLVTLVDSVSMSASELVAAALQDYEVGWIAGDRTFGKATVQNDQALNDELVLRKTTDRFYSPLGRSHQLRGITPNFFIESKPGASAIDTFAKREADLYINPMPPEGEPWKETRHAQVETIKNCIKNQGLSKSLYKLHEHDAIAVDYRLYFAEEILKCSGGW